jgi:hypothetical protein
VGLKVLDALKAKLGVALKLRFPARGVILELNGMVWVLCSVITVTSPLPLLAT